MEYLKTVERWGIFEAAIPGPFEGNPFTEHWLRAVFTGTNEQKTVEGFYDGNGIYRVRFMPAFEDDYHFCVTADFLDGELCGSFHAAAPQEGNHGPVHVAGEYHMAYADGTPYYSIGTTCYVWELQTDERIRETLENLTAAGFNKLRFCIFPKHYNYNLTEPRSYPFEGVPMDSSVLNEDNYMDYGPESEGNQWDFTRPNPEHFQNIDKCIRALADRGIEADLILWHPYDRCGFSKMTRADNERYLSYVIARFGAYRNVWWSLANEYDFCQYKTLEDWERFADILCEKDVYVHLRSIHNGGPMYDFSRPWITHCSIQCQLAGNIGADVAHWREVYHKPIVLDEMTYEGDIGCSYGNISGQELLRRFWEVACQGGYGGHGETYLSNDNILWWSHGGKLRGECWKRLKFLHNILKSVPGHGLAPIPRYWNGLVGVPEVEAMQPEKSYFLFYYGLRQPKIMEFDLRHFGVAPDTRYAVELIDTWNMTVTDAGVHCGRFRLPMPGKEYMAVRLRRIE